MERRDFIRLSGLTLGALAIAPNALSSRSGTTVRLPDEQIHVRHGGLYPTVEQPLGRGIGHFERHPFLSNGHLPGKHDLRALWFRTPHGNGHLYYNDDGLLNHSTHLVKCCSEPKDLENGILLPICGNISIEGKPVPNDHALIVTDSNARDITIQGQAALILI